MAKTQEEIKELLATPLFVEGLKSNYSSIKKRKKQLILSIISKMVQNRNCRISMNLSQQ